MIATSKALNFNVKNVLSKLVLTGFSQAKKGQTKAVSNSNTFFSSESLKFNANNITKNIGFGITHAKHVAEVLHEIPQELHLKRIQKTGAMAHCFNPRTHHQEDVPIRIVRTHCTVTFLPSVQFLQNEHTHHQKPQKSYMPEKDSTLSVYKFTCKNCGNHENRSIPENGYKFGTVLTGCDQCHQVMLVSDHLGWVQPKKQKHSTDLIFSKKQVHDLIRKNLKKVGINADKQKDLE